LEWALESLSKRGDPNSKLLSADLYKELGGSENDSAYRSVLLWNQQGGLLPWKQDQYETALREPNSLMRK
jgi:hypothetical protein